MGPARMLLVVVLVAGVSVASAAALGPVPHRHQMEALYVIDHHGHSPRNDLQLVEYSRPFHKIVGRCTIGVDTLTNMTIWLADKASVMGGRRVTSLMMLRSIARRIDWETPRKPCAQIYDLAEGHLEAGDP
jgi:hypothetical protein